MNILEHPAYESEWLSGIDLEGRNVTVTIAGVEDVTVPDRKGQPVQKVAVRFVKARKALLLNRTNAKSLARLFGPETDDWAGKGVTLRPEHVNAFGQTHLVVRVAGAATVKMQPTEQAA